VVHTLDKHPAVTLVDNNGDEVRANVKHLSNFDILVVAQPQFEGKIYLN
jgi:hypothetical protein